MSVFRLQSMPRFPHFSSQVYVYVYVYVYVCMCVCVCVCVCVSKTPAASHRRPLHLRQAIEEVRATLGALERP